MTRDKAFKRASEKFSKKHPGFFKRIIAEEQDWDRKYNFIKSHAQRMARCFGSVRINYLVGISAADETEVKEILSQEDYYKLYATDRGEVWMKRPVCIGN